MSTLSINQAGGLAMLAGTVILIISSILDMMMFGTVGLAEGFGLSPNVDVEDVMQNWVDNAAMIHFNRVLNTIGMILFIYSLLVIWRGTTGDTMPHSLARFGAILLAVLMLFNILVNGLLHVAVHALEFGTAVGSEDVLAITVTTVAYGASVQVLYIGWVAIAALSLGVGMRIEGMGLQKGFQYLMVLVAVFGFAFVVLTEHLYTFRDEPILGDLYALARIVYAVWVIWLAVDLYKGIPAIYDREHSV